MSARAQLPFLRADSGSTAVEFAMIGSLLIFLTLGAFESGRLLWTYYKVAHAMSGVPRVVALNPTDPALGDTVTQAIESQFSTAEQPDLTVTVAPEILNGVTYTRVETHYALPLIIPRIWDHSGDTFDVHSTLLIPMS